MPRTHWKKTQLTNGRSIHTRLTCIEIRKTWLTETRSFSKKNLAKNKFFFFWWLELYSKTVLGTHAGFDVGGHTIPSLLGRIQPIIDYNRHLTARVLHTVARNRCSALTVRRSWKPGRSKKNKTTTSNKRRNDASHLPDSQRLNKVEFPEIKTTTKPGVSNVHLFIIHSRAVQSPC